MCPWVHTPGAGRSLEGRCGSRSASPMAVPPGKGPNTVPAAGAGACSPSLDASGCGTPLQTELTCQEILQKHPVPQSRTQLLLP